MSEIWLIIGEWAHLFYVILLVSGINARYVWNRSVLSKRSGAHVQRRSRLERVLVDGSSTLGSRRSVVGYPMSLAHRLTPSEATVSKPLLYARGWGKKQAFCL